MRQFLEQYEYYAYFTVFHAQFPKQDASVFIAFPKKVRFVPHEQIE